MSTTRPTWTRRRGDISPRILRLLALAEQGVSARDASARLAMPHRTVQKHYARWRKAGTIPPHARTTLGPTRPADPATLPRRCATCSGITTATPCQWCGTQ